MSGFEKFQANDEWRSHFKKLLLANREIPTQTTEKTPEERFSFDIVENLQETVLKRKSTAAGEMENLENGENKENQRAHNPMSNGETKFGPDQKLFQMDESFEILEKMCNKTASDPNSTLFRYIHSENKEQIISNAKKHISVLTELQDLTDEVVIGQQSPLKMFDVTQLEDEEAPSRLWDNTDFGDTLLQTSPVKMVGLLRPSTIIEEYGDESNCTNASSQMTFESAVKGACSETSTSYVTANDYTATSSASYASKKPSEAELVEGLIDDVKFPDTEEESVSVKLSEDLNDETLLKESFSDTEGSIIEILSDEEGECKIGLKMEHLLGSYSPISDVEQPDESEADGAGVEGNSCNFNDTMEEVEYMMRKGLEFMAAKKESPKEQREEMSEPPETLKVKQNTFVLTPKKTEPLSSSKIQPALGKAIFKSPHKTTPVNKRTMPGVNEFAQNMKPIPKFDFFKKPLQSGIPTSLRSKDFHNKHFSHIVSPVGAYMKKTAVTPFMTDIKTTKNTNVQKSAAFQRLEMESRSYNPNFGNCDMQDKRVDSPKLNGIPAVTRHLPKKAYISSEFKHIVDERTPFTIPGGNKLRKYIEPAMLPSVVRHEGKLKVSGIAGHDRELKSKLPMPSSGASKTGRRTDASLADLSVMSGDVSMYTIMDAQKF